MVDAVRLWRDDDGPGIGHLAETPVRREIDQPVRQVLLSRGTKQVQAARMTWDPHNAFHASPATHSAEDRYRGLLITSAAWQAGAANSHVPHPARPQSTVQVLDEMMKEMQ